MVNITRFVPILGTPDWSGFTESLLYILCITTTWIIISIVSIIWICRQTDNDRDHCSPIISARHPAAVVFRSVLTPIVLDIIAAGSFISPVVFAGTSVAALSCGVIFLIVNAVNRHDVGR
jgi:hypothetical protein